VIDDIEDLPSNWSTTRVDRIASVNARIGWKALTASEYQDDGYAFLSTPNIRNREIDYVNVNFISEWRYEESPELRLMEGDVLLAKDGFTLGTVNVVNKLPRPATVNGSIAVLRPHSMNPSFLRYAISCDATQAYINSMKDGMDVLHLFQRDIKKIPLPAPPPEEQHRIADFLDREIQLIDALERARRAQQLLLHERAREHARYLVTGGNSERTWRPGTEWLGPIKAAWPTCSLIRISQVVMGTTFPHTYQGSATGAFPFVKVADFARADVLGRLNDAGNWINEAVSERLGARIVPPGAILYARVGAALLLNRRVITSRNCVIDDNVRAINFHSGYPRYWLHLLRLLDMGQLMSPGPVPTVSEPQISAVRLPLPPKSEQEVIAGQLDEALIKYGDLESKISRQLDLLAERRRALITAAVMGRIDVSMAGGPGIEGDLA
jgi:type I restriction enzyme S subunit